MSVREQTCPTGAPEASHRSNRFCIRPWNFVTLRYITLTLLPCYETPKSTTKVANYIQFWACISGKVWIWQELRLWAWWYVPSARCSGFDIEGSHVRDRGRMSSLFSIIMIAYVWCYLVGIFIHENIKPIKVPKHGRRAVSLFKYGLEYISQCLMNHTDRYRINIFKFLSYT